MRQPAIAVADTRLVPPINKRILITALLAALFARVVYLPVLSTPFFAEVPLDLGQVRYSTLACLRRMMQCRYLSHERPRLPCRQLSYRYRFVQAGWYTAHIR